MGLRYLSVREPNLYGNKCLRSYLVIRIFWRIFSKVKVVDTLELSGVNQFSLQFRVILRWQRGIICSEKLGHSARTARK